MRADEAGGAGDEVAHRRRLPPPAAAPAERARSSDREDVAGRVDPLPGVVARPKADEQPVAAGRERGRPDVEPDPGAAGGAAAADADGDAVGARNAGDVEA